MGDMRKPHRSWILMAKPLNSRHDSPGERRPPILLKRCILEKAHGLLVAWPWSLKNFGGGFEGPMTTLHGGAVPALQEARQFTVRRLQSRAFSGKEAEASN